jgi:VIT1/CCC1 family predicted Fe2+/Mn2+ transporter
MSALAIVTTLYESLNSMIDLIERLGAEGRKRRSRKLCRALSNIYFGPDGVLPLIESVARGKMIDTQEFEKKRAQFVAGEAEVRQALREIDFDEASGELSLAAKRILREIAYNKASMRDAISDEFLRISPGKLKEKRTQAKALKRKLMQLNSSIEGLERSLNPDAMDR